VRVKIPCTTRLWNSIAVARSPSQSLSSLKFSRMRWQAISDSSFSSHPYISITLQLHAHLFQPRVPAHLGPHLLFQPRPGAQQAVNLKPFAPENQRPAVQVASWAVVVGPIPDVHYWLLCPLMKDEPLADLRHAYPVLAGTCALFEVGLELELAFLVPYCLVRNHVSHQVSQSLACQKQLYQRFFTSAQNVCRQALSLKQLDYLHCELVQFHFRHDWSKYLLDGSQFLNLFEK